MAQQQQAPSPDLFFGDLVQSKGGENASSSTAFSGDAVLLSSSLDGPRPSAAKSTGGSMPGTPMVRKEIIS